MPCEQVDIKKWKKRKRQKKKKRGEEEEITRNLPHKWKHMPCYTIPPVKTSLPIPFIDS